MRFSTLSTILLPTLVVASQEVELAPPSPQAAISEISAITTAPSAQTTPAPSTIRTTALAERLELRQEAVSDPVAATNAAQFPTVTTAWLPTVIDGTTTYAAVVYTQTFASVVDQGASAASGSIGMGTLTGTVGTVQTVEADSVSAGARSGSSSRVLSGLAVVMVGLFAGTAVL